MLKLNSKSFQNPQKRLLVFAVMFALIGGLIVWQSHALEVNHPAASTTPQPTCSQYLRAHTRSTCTQTSTRMHVCTRPAGRRVCHNIRRFTLSHLQPKPWPPIHECPLNSDMGCDPPGPVRTGTHLPPVD